MGCKIAHAQSLTSSLITLGLRYCPRIVIDIRRVAIWAVILPKASDRPQLDCDIDMTCNRFAVIDLKVSLLELPRAASVFVLALSDVAAGAGQKIESGRAACGV